MSVFSPEQEERLRAIIRSELTEAIGAVAAALSGVPRLVEYKVREQEDIARLVVRIQVEGEEAVFGPKPIPSSDQPANG